MYSKVIQLDICVRVCVCVCACACVYVCIYSSTDYFPLKVIIMRGTGAAAAQRSGRDELPHVQGQEQWLHFAGAAMERYSTSKVRKTQVRQ